MLDVELSLMLHFACTAVLCSIFYSCFSWESMFMVGDPQGLTMFSYSS